MPNALYPAFKEALMTGAIDLTSVDLRLALIDTDEGGYDPADVFLADLPSDAVVAISDVLTGVTVTDGVLRSDDTEFASVTGPQCEALVMFVDTGDPATSPLAVSIDTGIGGMPVLPNSGNIGVTAPAGGWVAL